MNQDFSEQVKKYAAAYHRLTCHVNHADQCGWFWGEGGRYWIYKKTEELLPELQRNFTVGQLHLLADLLQCPKYED